MNNNEFWRLQKAANLTNKECAELLGVTKRSVEKWRVSNPEAPKAAILVLRSIANNKPVSCCDLSQEEIKAQFESECE